MKILFLPLILIFTTSKIYCQDSTKFYFWVGYENLYSLNKQSDFFSNKKGYKQELEIKNGNGIIGVIYYNLSDNVLPYLKSGYMWHKKFSSDTLINSNNFTKEVYYRNIPIAVGTEIFFFSKSFRLIVNFDVNYNIMTRNFSIIDLSQESTTRANNFGYSIGINPFSNTSFPLNTHIGLAKNGDSNFIFINILIPISLWRIF